MCPIKKISLKRTRVKTFRIFTTTEVKCMNSHFLMFVVDINSHNFIYFRHLFHTTDSVTLHNVELIRNVPFHSLNHLLWTQNRASHQYRQFITTKYIDSFPSNFNGIWYSRQCKVIREEFFMHLGASVSNLRGRSQGSIKYYFL